MGSARIAPTAVSRRWHEWLALIAVVTIVVAGMASIVAYNWDSLRAEWHELNEPTPTTRHPCRRGDPVACEQWLDAERDRQAEGGNFGF